MKEFESSFTALANGLRAFENSSDPALLECFNALPMGAEGLQPHEAVTLIEPLLPDCGSWTVSWPWPQIVFGSYYALGFALADTEDCSTGVPYEDDSLMLYEIVKDGSWSVDPMWDLGPVSMIDQVDVADFGQFYVVSTFGYDADDEPVVESYHRLPGINKPNIQYQAAEIDGNDGAAEFPAFITACNFNGQAVVGGILSDNPIWHDRDLHSVCWSGIGNFDFNPERTMEAGFADLDWGQNGQGIVYKVRKLGQQVVAFGSGGISLLMPVSDPVSTYGIRNLSMPGVASGNHVAGDETIVGWIDVNNDFWLMDANAKSKKLGYREWLSALTGTIIVSYVPGRKRFFISNGTKGYVLAEGGLYECHQCLTGGGLHQEQLCGFFVNNADYEWRVETTDLDFKQRAFKTVEFVEVHGASELVSARVKYKSTLVGSFNALAWKSVNPHGVLFETASGSDFRIGVKGTDYRLSTDIIDGIKVRVKLTDKRNIRGLYAADKNFT